ncbi:MAG TPA: NAD(P)/FAD-dependent oxidoreductase, partial [Thermoprotei archaeon]|nr:NAD(P)/FAD-dependent oxidoreductase [Thermoprotei archaeon]
MRKFFDIVVIGAGPSGLIFVRKFLNSGLNIAMFEEHGEIGLPNHCTGIVSISGINSLRVGDIDKFVENRFRGAIIYSPNCKVKLYVWRRNWQAYLIDRHIFDKILFRHVCEDINVKLREGVKDIAIKNGVWKIKTNRNIYYSKILIDGEGARYNIVRKLGLKLPNPKNILPAVQFEMSNIRDIDEDFVEIFLGSRWAPGFFGWIAPKD